MTGGPPRLLHSHSFSLWAGRRDKPAAAAGPGPPSGRRSDHVERTGERMLPSPAHAADRTGGGGSIHIIYSGKRSYIELRKYSATSKSPALTPLPKWHFHCCSRKLLVAGFNYFIICIMLWCFVFSLSKIIIWKVTSNWSSAVKSTISHPDVVTYKVQLPQCCTHV